MTIVEAIKKVMLAAARPLSSREAFEAIVTQGLYQFQAKDPQHVVPSGDVRTWTSVAYCNFHATPKLPFR